MNAISMTLDQWVQNFEGVQRDVPNLAGIQGRLLLEIEKDPVAILLLTDGHVQLSRELQATPPPDAVVDFADPQALVDVVSGKWNAVVALLQGQMSISGNHSFAIKAVLGLQADKPFAMSVTPEESQEESHHAD